MYINSQYAILGIFVLLLVVIIINILENYPTNGEEPDYDPEKWNLHKEYNNCYAYALDNLKIRSEKPQPGEQENKEYTCENLKSWINMDLIDKTNIKHHLLEGNNRNLCPIGHHKIYLVHNDYDYHFYRLDSDGIWSHKPGSSEVTRLDGNNKLITDPSNASHNYNNFNYDKQCGFLCIPKIDELF